MAYEPDATTRAFAAVTLRDGTRLLDGFEAACDNDRVRLARLSVVFLLCNQVQAVGDLVRMPTLREALDWCRQVAEGRDPAMPRIHDVASTAFGDPLTEKQEHVLSALRAGAQTASQIAHANGWRSASGIQRCLAGLELRGLVRRIDRLHWMPMYDHRVGEESVA